MAGEGGKIRGAGESAGEGAARGGGFAWKGIMCSTRASTLP